MKKILITGAPGFAASHLVKRLLSEDVLSKDSIEIHGTKRVRSDMYRLEKKGLIGEINFHLIELTDAHSVYNVIAKVMPDQIYHLAAQDYVESSWEAPHETFHTNIDGTINLFEAVRRCYNPEPEKWISTGRDMPIFIEYPKILVTSTSETYGLHKEEIYEGTEQHPNNPYGISKLAQDMLARLYSRSYNIPVVITRSFNITGWGRNDPFVDSDFARQIAEIEKGAGREAVLNHGNLDSKRTFFDVKDAVRGYYLAMESKYKDGDVFCFGTDTSTSIKDLLGILFSLTDVEIRSNEQQDRLRPVDTSDMRCDASKAKQLLGWEPTIPLKQSLEDLLNYWRERL